MENKNWRRIAILGSLFIAGVICFVAGFAVGSIETAKVFVSFIIKFMNETGINIDITRAELLEYFIKLKGGL